MVLEAARGATGPLSIQNMLLLEMGEIQKHKTQKVFLVLSKDVQNFTQRNKSSRAGFPPPPLSLCWDWREDGDAGAAWGCSQPLKEPQHLQNSPPPKNRGTLLCSSAWTGAWHCWPWQGECQAPGTARDSGSYPGDPHNLFGSKNGSSAP